MNKYILDSSAILAVINGERGADAVEKVLDRSVVSAVNLSETISRMVLEGVPADEALEAITDMIEDVIPFDQKIALLSARLMPLTRPHGLSLGDRACLGTAEYMEMEVITADKVWAKLDLPIKITLIR